MQTNTTTAGCEMRIKEKSLDLDPDGMPAGDET